MADVLSHVLATYQLIDSNYSALRNACTTDQQRSALDAQYTAAQHAYYACVNQTLEDDDPEVATLGTDLQAASSQVEQSVTQLNDISKTIDNITKAVNIMTQLAAKVPV
jgi:hypothetical protein